VSSGAQTQPLPFAVMVLAMAQRPVAKQRCGGLNPQVRVQPLLFAVMASALPSVVVVAEAHGCGCSRCCSP
jgi:hypothetical protein